MDITLACDHSNENYLEVFSCMWFCLQGINKYKVVVTSCLWMRPLPESVTIQMKAIEQYFHVLLFIMLYKVGLSCKFGDDTQVCDHFNESH